jgi:hypothetical protein
LVDGAPAALNTLNELAAALGDDAAFSTTVTNSIATKLPLAGGAMTGDLTVSGKVGINNSSPASKLDVLNGSANSQVASFSGADSGGGLKILTASTTRDDDTVVLKASDAFGEISFVSDNTEVMRINKDNNVGINNVSPDQRLHITDGTSSGAVLRLERSDTSMGNNDVYGGIEFEGNDTDTNANGIRGFIRGLGQGTGGGMKLEFGTAGGGAAIGAARMTLDADGNVSIGGSLTVDPASVGGKFLALDTSASGDGHILLQRAGSNKWQITSGTTNALQFYNYTAGGESMRIDSSGNMLVGCTTVNADGVSINPRSSGSNTTSSIIFNRANTTIAGRVLNFLNNSNLVGYIEHNNSSTSYNTSSDYRLKTDAQPMVGATARVQALNPVNFEWISSGERVDGFLAHEAKAVVPECVSGIKDAMMDQEYEVTPAVIDENGTTTTEAVMGTRSVPDYQGIDQSKIVPLLTAALREALTKIDDMETRLAALEDV